MKLKPRKIARYGWRPDLPDARDLLLGGSTVAIPDSVDLRSGFVTPPFDQGQLGSCTANAISGAIEYAEKALSLPVVMPSRLFIYYEERLLEGDPGQDGGAQIRDGMKVIAKIGYPPETDWPYDISKFAEAPPDALVQAAAKDHVTKYLRVGRNLVSMQSCLASGHPFVFGFTVYDSFESQEVAQSGIVPMPGPSEQVLGGHAVLACGYDNATRRFLVRNSWGTGWGQSGYFTIPYDYLLNRGLASDFWTIRQEVEAA